MSKKAATQRKKKDGPVSLRTEYRMLSRRRILDAAHDCIAENGYASTTMEDIAQAANVSRTTLYQHFTKKKDVIHVLAMEVTDSFIESFSDFPSHKKGLSRADVRALVEKIRNHEVQHIGFLEASREAAAIESSIKVLADDRFKFVIDFIVERVSKKAKNAGMDLVRARAWICFSATDECIRRAIDPSWHIDMESAVEELTELWCKLFLIDA